MVGFQFFLEEIFFIHSLCVMINRHIHGSKYELSLTDKMFNMHFVEKSKVYKIKNIWQCLEFALYWSCLILSLRYFRMTSNIGICGNRLTPLPLHIGDSFVNAPCLSSELLIKSRNFNVKTYSYQKFSCCNFFKDIGRQNSADPDETACVGVAWSDSLLYTTGTVIVIDICPQ